MKKIFKFLFSLSKAIVSSIIESILFKKDTSNDDGEDVCPYGNVPLGI